MEILAFYEIRHLGFVEGSRGTIEGPLTVADTCTNFVRIGLPQC